MADLQAHWVKIVTYWLKKEYSLQPRETFVYKTNSSYLQIFHKDGTSETLNQADENKCNWMCLVRPATNTNHQNLIAYQYKGALYYSATQDIPQDVELRVWYAPHYAPRLGQSLLSGEQ